MEVKINFNIDSSLTSDDIIVHITAAKNSEQLQKLLDDIQKLSKTKNSLIGFKNEEWEIYNSTPEIFMAESVESIFLRIKSFFDEQFSKNENVLIVAHGGSLRLISYYLSNRDIFIKEVYESKYKDAKQPVNTALFEINPNLTFMKPIHY